MKVKALKSLSVLIGIWIAVGALLSGLSITAFAAEEPSKVKFSITITDVNGTPEPISGGYVYLWYPYIHTSETGKTTSTIRTESCKVEAVSGTPGKYTFEGTLSEKINTLNSDGKKNCYIYFYYGEARVYVESAYVEYKDENTEMKFDVKVKAVTPGWKNGYIYSKDYPGSYYAYAKSGDEPYTGGFTLYANGGKLGTAGGGIKNTKTRELVLIENFYDTSCNTTQSKQISWIVTKEKVCPTSFKQLSDSSVCKVSKGKVTAVAPGTAYVWACRVDPNDKTKVSEDESCCLRVWVEDAPKSITLKESRAEDAPKLSKLNLSIGESKTVYMKFDGKTDDIEKDCTFEVTKGSEYVSVSGAYGYFTVTALPTVLEKGKTVKATVVVQSQYSKAKAKLTITVGNEVVEVGKAEPLAITSSDANQALTIDAETINSYITTSGKKYFPEDETISAMAMTGKPKVFVTSAPNVTDDMVYKTTSSGTSIKFSGTKSSSVSATYKDGVVSVKVKKNAPAESGNIIIVFSTKKYLVIPFTIS